MKRFLFFIFSEKRRFAQITDLKEAKVVMGSLFDLITKDKHSQVKSLESKVLAHESTIEALKKQVYKIESIKLSSNLKSHYVKKIFLKTAFGVRK